MAYLALVRHGESEWNAKGLWTGWTDIKLTEKGKEQAREAANALEDIKFNVAYTSKLERAKHTLEEIEEALNYSNLPSIEDAALNERDYGKLTGERKEDIKAKYGEEQFIKLRRGWDVPISGGETLKDVYNRVVPYYQKNILPNLKSGENVLVVAHGNSLRALVKDLENISDEDVSKLEIEICEVRIYQIDENGRVTNKEIRQSHSFNKSLL